MNASLKGFRLFLIIPLVVTLMSGCERADQPSSTTVATPTPEVTVEPTVEPTKEPIKLLNNYDIGVKAPLIRNDEQIGTVRVNQIEKVGINDLTNVKAQENSINFSYSINMTIDLFAGSGATENLTCIPEVFSNGTLVTSVADVGWTGFEKNVSSYNDDYKVTKHIEIGMQPESLSVKKGILSLSFKDAQNNSYKTITCDKNWFKKSKKGPNLLTKSKEVKINSLGGAKYAMLPKSVFYEDHIVDYVNGESVTNKFFDIDYYVKAYKAPKKNKCISLIRKTNGSYKMNTKATMGFEYVGSKGVIYKQYKNIERQTYSDRKDTAPYVTNDVNIPFGKYATITTNRKAVVTNGVCPNFVRIRFEYPEEAAALNWKQLLKFNGRFHVYQVGISRRKLTKSPY